MDRRRGREQPELRLSILRSLMGMLLQEDRQDDVAAVTILYHLNEFIAQMVRRGPGRGAGRRVRGGAGRRAGRGAGRGAGQGLGGGEGRGKGQGAGPGFSSSSDLCRCLLAVVATFQRTTAGLALQPAEVAALAPELDAMVLILLTRNHAFIRQLALQVRVLEPSRTGVARLTVCRAPLLLPHADARAVQAALHGRPSRRR